MIFQISKLLTGAASNVKTLGQRLSLQVIATHDPSDRADLNDWIEACNAQSQALTAVAAAYGPIIQCAINTGGAGLTHRILVQSCPEGSDVWTDVSEHKFEVI